MKYSKLLEHLQNLIGFIPTVENLEKASGVAKKTLYARRDYDRNFSYEELEKIENFYGISGKIIGGNGDCIELDYYPEVLGSCGNGAFVPSETKEKISLSKTSIVNFSTSAQYSVINSVGDSMMPYIHDGDKLIVRHWNGEQIKDNSVYVFRYIDEIFVKRLSKNIDQILIKSDNPIYDTRIISISKDFQIIGQIVGLLRNVD